MRILVAESDTSLRAALCVWLAQMQSVELAGLARSRTELLPAIRVSNADVVILDWELSASGFQLVLAELRELAPVPKIIVLSWQPELRAAVLSQGADAFVHKLELPYALRSVMAELWHETSTPKPT